MNGDEVPFYNGGQPASRFGSLVDKRRKSPIVIAGIACIFFAVIGGLVTWLLPWFIHSAIRDAAKLETPRSSPYKTFVDGGKSDKVQLKYSYYFYNVTNPYDVMNNGAYPELQEVGPYTWQAIKTRPEEHIAWHPDATVSYQFDYNYIYLPEESAGPTSDILCVPSVPFLGLLANSGFRKLIPDDKIFEALRIVTQGLYKWPWGYVIKPSPRTFFDNITVHDMFWNIPSRFENAMMQVDPDAMLLVDLINGPIKAGASDNVTKHPKDLDYVHTGGRASENQPQVEDVDKSYFRMKKWHNMEKLPYWGEHYNDTYANMINGTDGTVMAPFIKKGESKYVFVDDLYRSVLLQQMDTVEYQDIELYRYEITPSYLESYHTNPNNKPFFMEYKGFLPTPPSLSLPYFFSQAHYIDTNVSAMHCKINYLKSTSESDLHTQLDFEPLTGDLFRGKKQLQMNIKLQEMHADNGTVWPNTKGIKTTLMPILWLNEHVDLPKHLCDEFKNYVKTPLIIAKVLGPILLVISALSAFLCVGLIVRFRRKGPQMYAKLDGDNSAGANPTNGSMATAKQYYGANEE